jgi:hypothetical protein
MSTLIRADEDGRAARERAFRLVVTQWADFDTHWQELERVVHADEEERRAIVNALSEIAATLIVMLQGEWEDQGDSVDKLEVIGSIERVIDRLSGGG